MVLWAAVVLGIFLLAFAIALYAGARAGPLRMDAERIDYLRTLEVSGRDDSASVWDAKSPLANVSPDMHHLMAPMGGVHSMTIAPPYGVRSCRQIH